MVSIYLNYWMKWVSLITLIIHKKIKKLMRLFAIWFVFCSIFNVHIGKQTIFGIQWLRREYLHCQESHAAVPSLVDCAYSRWAREKPSIYSCNLYIRGKTWNYIWLWKGQLVETYFSFQINLKFRCYSLHILFI
jgi:hypothetical protein